MILNKKKRCGEGGSGEREKCKEKADFFKECFHMQIAVLNLKNALVIFQS